MHVGFVDLGLGLKLGVRRGIYWGLTSREGGGEAQDQGSPGGGALIDGALRPGRSAPLFISGKLSALIKGTEGV